MVSMFDAERDQPWLWFRRRLQRQSLLQFLVHSPSSAGSWADGDWLDLGRGSFAFRDIPQGETLLEWLFAVSFRFRKFPCTVVITTRW